LKGFDIIKDIILLKKYYTSLGDYQGFDFILFNTKYFKFNWFTDCGEWFVYIYFGKRYFRFSGAGFLMGKIEKRR
jgi:hypothetical protein